MYKGAVENFKKLFFLSIVLGLFLVPFLTAAQDLELEYPEIAGEEPTTVQAGLPQYVKYVFNFAIAIAGIVAVAVFIWGGFIFLTSSGNTNKLKEGKDRLISALLGILVLFFSYILLTTINPELVVFDFPPLPIFESREVNLPPEIKPEDASVIYKELPLSQAVRAGVWEEERTNRREQFILDFERFLTKEEVTVRDSDISNNTFTKISNLNKYLGNKTNDCKSSNLTALCSSPETGGLPIGCTGDPCQTDQDLDIEPDSPRAKINQVLEINREKKASLLEYQKEIEKERDELKEEIRKFQEIEGEIIACQNQNGELTTLNDFLNIKQNLQESGTQTISSFTYYASRGDDLTFYCTIGGTVFDYPYSSLAESFYAEEIAGSIADPSDVDVSSSLEPARMGCPVNYSTGETLDNLREKALIEIFKLDHVADLTEDLMKKLQNMEELVSQCNETNSEVSCACDPNPWYGCCSPVPCGPMVAYCRSRCLQVVGGCSGKACPTESIKETVEKIKEIENKILKEIEDIKPIYERARSWKNYLSSLSEATGACASSDTEREPWNLWSCDDALQIMTYDDNGNLITSCHPRDLFCCSTSDEGRPPMPATGDAEPFYILPEKKFPPLPNINGCPEGWLCAQNMSTYNQYQDASAPLKQLLSCMRVELDRVQEANEEEMTIGYISFISDPKIYQETCDWEAGPTKPEGCTFMYGTENGKKKISAHYGGAGCNFNHKSYAVKINVWGDQKQYADEIVKAANRCSPGAYVLDKFPYIHIDIGNVYQCKTSES